MAEDRIPVPKFGVDLGIVETNVISDIEADNMFSDEPGDVQPVKVQAKAKPAAPKNTPPPQPEEEEEEFVPVILDASVLETEEDEDDEEETLPAVKPKTKAKEVPKPTEENEEDDNPFVSISKELKDLGVFTPLEDEPDIKDGTAFRDRFNTEIQSRTEATLSNFLGRFGDDYYDAFQAIFVDGVDPREYYQQTQKIESLSDLDLAVVANQKIVLREYYKSNGLSNEKIEERIQKAEDRGDLEDDASSFHSILLQKEQKELQLSVARKQQEQYQKQQEYNNYISSVSKILNDKLTKKEFDSIPVDQKFAQSVGDFLTQNKYRLSNGDLITDFDMELMNLKKPENHEKKVKFAMLLKLMETDPTFSKLKKAAISQESNKLFEGLTRKKKAAKVQDEEIMTPWKL